MFGRCAAAILSVILIILIACPGVLGADYIPLLPDDLCIPDKTGIEITPPVLQQAGSPLIVSNSPEVVRLDSGAVALYRTSVHAAHFRVFLHHENLSGRTLKIGFAITNPSTASSSIEVYLGRNSQGLLFACQSTVSSSPITAGSLALKHWFGSPPSDNYLCTLPPGKTRYILQDVPTGATVTGMYDIGLKSKTGSRATLPRAFVTIVACDNPPSDPTVLRVLPPDKGTWYRRGLFAHSDRIGRVQCNASQICWLDIAGPNEGPYARLMKHEMEPALDDPKGLNPGNYGVLYSLHITVKNPTTKKMRVLCLPNAAGGAGC